EFLGKSMGKYHQYILYHSVDGKSWKILADKSANKTDVPHDYIELEKPVQARYIKMVNLHMPTGKFALSGLRVFGFGKGEKPSPVEGFIVLRTEKDKRSAFIKWKPSDNAYAYKISYGIAPDKLYNSILVHDQNEYWMKYMDRTQSYYYSIQALNENGLSDPGPLIKAE
ncbi:MAG TPA: discoidin domain-containing protein, partial [Ferruginibacter sp.]|nr:discoidin domain-containing protein [Ferruginibacter sp.]